MLVLVSSVAYAAPLDEVGLGKGRLSFGIDAYGNLTCNGHSYKFAGKPYFEGEVGLLNGFSVEARTSRLRLKGSSARLDSSDLLAKYKIVPGVSMMAGYHVAEISGYPLKSRQNTTVVGGVQARRGLWEKGAVWGDFSFGEGYICERIGLTHRLSPLVGVDVSYYVRENDDMIGRKDIKSKGVSLGFTYEF